MTEDYLAIYERMAAVRTRPAARVNGRITRTVSRSRIAAATAAPQTDAA